MGLIAPKPQIIFENKINVLRTIQFQQIESGGIHMTVKEFRAISASTVFVLIPVSRIAVDGSVCADEYDIFHTRTGNNYAFSDDVNTENREIDFVDAEQEVGLDEPVIYVYTK